MAEISWAWLRNFSDPVLLTRLNTGHVFEITSGGYGVVIEQTTPVKSFPGHAIHNSNIVDMRADRHLVMRELYIIIILCRSYYWMSSTILFLVSLAFFFPLSSLLKKANSNAHYLVVWNRSMRASASYA